MAVSIVNCPKDSDDEKFSFTGFLPLQTQQALPNLPIFETIVVVPQQNEGVTNKNLLSFNKRNSFPRSAPQNSSFTNRHSVCGDSRTSGNKSPSVKIRRRAASFGENSVIHNNNNNNNNKNNKNNNNSNSLTTETKSLNRKPVTSLSINIPKSGSPRSSPGSPKPSPKGKSSSPIKSSTMQHHIEQEHEQEIIDSNKLQKIQVSDNNQKEKELDKSSLDNNNNRLTFPADYDQNQNNNTENNNVENPQLVSDNNNSNLNSETSKPQSYNRAFPRHSLTLNSSAGGSSTNLRKSIYKEPSFTKKLRRVFSLSNIKQDDNSNPPTSSSANIRFSSLRNKKYNYNNEDDNDSNSSSNNNDKDDDTSVSSVSSNGDNVPSNNNKSFRRRTIIDLFSSSKNEKKRNKQRQHMDELKGNNDINKKKQNGFIPLRSSSLQSSDNDGSHRQNSTSPLNNQFRINKSDDNSPSLSSPRPSSLPPSARNEEAPSPRRLSVPAPLSNNNTNNDDSNNNRTPFSNPNASRSVPSLTLFKDTDVLPPPSTPSLKRLQFSSTILIHETWTRDDYDRRGDQSTCSKLTPILAQKIKQELNDYKLIEMEVHEDSKNNTHFFA